MYKFLEIHNLPKLSQEESKNLNRQITPSNTKAVIKKLPTHKGPEPVGFTSEFYHTFKEKLTQILLNHSKKFKGRKDLTL